MHAANDVPHVSPEEALGRAQKGDVILIDVREPDEVCALAIAGAVNVPLTRFDPQAVLAVAGDKEIIFFCKMGGRATNACQYFTGLTGRAASCMTGSITAWVQKGLPVTSGE